MKQLFFLLSFTLLFFSTGIAQEDLRVEEQKGKSGSTYTVIYKNETTIQFVTTRPDPNDRKIRLCIPAAFTDVGNGQIDGIYAVEGVVHHKDSINTRLGGIFLIEKGQVSMLDAKHGAAFHGTFLQISNIKQRSFFQQIWCIENGVAASFRDTKRFQRRGIAVMKDGGIAIIESKGAITLAVFSEDLVALGVQNLMYTDMGAWDEGWYRDPATAGRIITIGKNRSETARQSNWIIFKK